MRTIDLALKDIKQILRDKQSLLFLIVMPVIFTFFFGFMFSTPGEGVDPRLAVGVLNLDADGLLSPALDELLAASSTVRPVAFAAEDAAKLDEQVSKGELGAAVIVPRGYGQAALAGQPLPIEVILDEQSQNGQTARRALQTTFTRLVGLAQSAQYALAEYERQAGGQTEADQAAFLKDALAAGAAEWQTPGLSVRATGPVAAQTDSERIDANPFIQFSPGMIIQFAIFGLIQAAMVLVIERRSGAMQRLLTTPLTRTGFIAGHVLSIFTIVFAQQTLLIAFGQAFLRVDYLRQPLAVLLMMLALSLFIASLGLLIATLAKKEEQVVVMTMAAMFIFSALGGSWFPLEVAGPAFAAIGHLTPAAWAMDGFQNILLRGLGMQSVLLPAGILLAYGLAFFGLAVWRFKFE